MNSKSIINPLINLIKKAADKGAFHLISSNVIIQFIGFGLIIFVSKQLTKAEVGNLKLLQSYAAFFIIIGTFGYNAASLKICSEDATEAQKISDFSYTLRRVFMMSLISILAAFVFSYFYLNQSNQELAFWLKVYSPVILFASLGLCCRAYLQSQKRIKDVSKVQLIIRLVFILIIFCSSFIWGFNGVVIATVISYIIGLLIYFPFIDLVKIIKTSVSTSQKKRINKYSAHITVGAAISMFAQYADVYLLAYLKVPQDQIGLYSIALVFFMGGTAVMGAIQMIVTPYFSEKEHDLRWVRSTALKYQGIVILLSIAAACALIFASWIITKYYYGPGYELSFQLSIILLFKFILWSCFSIIGACLFGLGVFKEGNYIALVSTIISIYMSYQLFTLFGIYGVAYGQVIGAAVTLLLIYPLFWSKTKLNKK